MISAAKSIWRGSKHPNHDFQSFHVKGLSSSTEHVEEFDLLKDRFIQEVEVQKLPKHRGVVSESMCTAISKAYNKLKTELEAAQALGIEQ